jgi:hypothetical protein
MKLEKISSEKFVKLNSFELGKMVGGAPEGFSESGPGSRRIDANTTWTWSSDFVSHGSTHGMVRGLIRDITIGDDITPEELISRYPMYQ